MTSARSQPEEPTDNAPCVRASQGQDRTAHHMRYEPDSRRMIAVCIARSGALRSLPGPEWHLQQHTLPVAAQEGFGRDPSNPPPLADVINYWIEPVRVLRQVV